MLSLVPSWTETLVSAGIEVCGRTRYCLHPQEKIKHLPIVGGTKKVDWQVIRNLRPDVIVMDKEENPQDFAEHCPCPYIVTHVQNLASCQQELYRLGKDFKNQTIKKWSQEMTQVLQCPPEWSFAKVPGELERLGPSEGNASILYVIWKNPWMAIGPSTYIHSVLEFLGAPLATPLTSGPYPVLAEEELKKNYLLFSSEPFPFGSKKKELIQLGYQGSIVDGESYGWFGIRGLVFLKKQTARA